MAKRTSQNFMITCSPAEPYSDTEEVAILEVLTKKSNGIFAVREYGSKGTHPHLHILVHTDDPTRSDLLRKHVLSKKVLHGGSKEIVVSMCKDDPPLVVAKYLQKEPNSKILANTFIDLENLPDIPKYIKDTLVGKRVLSVGEAPYVIVEYCHQNDLSVPTTLPQLYQILTWLVKYDYVVHNVVKNKKDILHIIHMIIDNPECPNRDWAEQFSDPKLT